MAEYTLSQWILFFYIYCFLGWVWESAYVSVCRRKLVNRGFLKGPFLPIYGSGAICILVVTIPVRGNIPAMCIVGMVSATVLEYVTGYVMERLFGVRYWDYSDKFLNLQGYVCLMSTLCWGVMTVLVVDVLHVRIEELVLAVEERYVQLIVLVMTPVLTVDFVTSFNAALRLRDLLVRSERLTEELRRLGEKKEELEAALSGAGGRARAQIAQELRELYISAGEKKARLQDAYSDSIRGLLRRNPTAVSTQHRESFARLKHAMSRKLEEFRVEADAHFESFMSSAGERIDVFMTETGERFGEMKNGASEKLGGMYSGASERFGEMKNGASEKLGEMKNGASEKLGERKSRASEKPGERKSEASEKLGEIKSGAREKLGERKKRDE